MKTVECDFESEVLTAALQARMPESPRMHVAGCAICADVAAVAAAIHDARERMRGNVSVPDSGRVWWLAQLRARREAAKAAGRPITAIQVIALACAMGLLGACFGATSTWFQAGLSGAPFLREHGLIVFGAALALVLVPGAVYLAIGRD